MEIAKITIPKHIRQINLSEKQRPIFFEWNGLTIKSERKNIKVPRIFFINPKAEGFRVDGILIEDLKPQFCISIVEKSGKVLDYIKFNKHLPVDMSNIWGRNCKAILYEKTGEGYSPVIANHTKAGKPNVYHINGQDIYSGYLTGHNLTKVMDAIKNCYRPFISLLPVITEYPIEITCDVYDTLKLSHSNHKSKLGERWDVDNYVFPYLKAFPDLLTSEGIIRDDDRLHIPSNIPAKFHPINNHEDRKLVFTISKVLREEIVGNEDYKGYHLDPENYGKEETVITGKKDTGVIKLNQQQKLF